VSTTPVPLTEVELTVTGFPSTRTVNELAPAVVEPRVSLYVRVNEVPRELTAADEKVGAVVSTTTVEPFVTAKFVMDNRSAPDASCTALFVVDASEAGAA
jgi:hypothetical protein